MDRPAHGDLCATAPRTTGIRLLSITMPSMPKLVLILTAAIAALIRPNEAPPKQSHATNLANAQNTERRRDLWSTHSGHSATLITVI